ncbi:MAG: twin-arginine translocase subunit TatB, partial [Caldilineaceae bacterium]|nr:twin-arginine translocase subunit TatB [Caldilineaceae bacterium]
MDSFFGIGVFELVFIVIFALIFLGPERLPGLFRQIIGVIRQVRDLTADVTRQFNDEFGDLTELDPRRQIQKALNETTADIKEATKPVTKTLNKATAKTPAKPTTNPAAKPATDTKPTPKSTAAKATTDVAAKAEDSADLASATAAAAGVGAASVSDDAVENASPAAEKTTDDTTESVSSPPAADAGDKALVEKPRPTPSQPSADDQISP